MAAVAAANQELAVAQEYLRGSVERAREAGHTWQEIGDTLGTTRQAAFQRFGRPIDPRTGAPMTSVALEDAAERAVEFLADYLDGEWERVRGRFDETMAEQLNAARLAAAWAQAVATFGQYESMGEPFVRAAADYTVVHVELHFEAGDCVARISYDQQGRVAGLYITPARP